MLDFSRFKRPRKLSDPGRDFNREDLEAILATDWYRVAPFNSILIDELANSSIRLSASGRIVTHYMRSHQDAPLEKFWKEYLV